MKKLLTDAERLRHMYQHPDSWPRLAFLCVKNIHQRDESGSTPLTSVCQHIINRNEFGSQKFASIRPGHATIRGTNSLNQSERMFRDIERFNVALRNVKRPR